MAKRSKSRASGSAAGREGQEQYWRDVVAKQKASGLNHSAFCRREEIPYHRYTYWRRRLAQSLGRDQSSEVSIVPVTLRPASATPVEPKLEVRLVGGHVLAVPAGFSPESHIPQ